jgi:hypothetical protein
MQTLTVFYTNLFEVAARELGSAMQWINIAHVNNLTDSMIRGQKTITIPEPSSAFADGIGPQ